MALCSLPQSAAPDITHTSLGELWSGSHCSAASAVKHEWNTVQRPVSLYELLHGHIQMLCAAECQALLKHHGLTFLGTSRSLFANKWCLYCQDYAHQFSGMWHHIASDMTQVNNFDGLSWNVFSSTRTTKLNLWAWKRKSSKDLGSLSILMCRCINVCIIEWFPKWGAGPFQGGMEPSLKLPKKFFILNSDHVNKLTLMRLITVNRISLLTFKTNQQLTRWIWVYTLPCLWIIPINKTWRAQSLDGII